MVLSPPLSVTWGDLVDRLVAERGSLAEVVRALYELHPTDLPEDPGTVERGLRRLRSRGTKPADKYGRLILRAFSLPPSIARWARALGTYHGPLIDLPMSLRREQLRLWDRAPLLESEHAVWIHLAQASLAHHDRELDQTDRRLQLARLGARRAGPAAHVELSLFEARRCADRRERGRALEVLLACEAELDTIEAEDAACFRSRWLDQRAYLASREWRRRPEALVTAEAFTLQIPDEGAPFVRFRRHHGLAWLRWRRGLSDAAEHARTAIRVAGDGGLLRLRSQALMLLANIDPGRAAELRSRSRAILESLEGP